MVSLERGLAAAKSGWDSSGVAKPLFRLSYNQGNHQHEEYS